jgi:hypothetical protein
LGTRTLNLQKSSDWAQEHLLDCCIWKECDVTWASSVTTSWSSCLAIWEFQSKTCRVTAFVSKSSIRLPEWPLLLVTHSSSMDMNSHKNGEPHAWTSSPGSN